MSNPTSSEPLATREASFSPTDVAGPAAAGPQDGPLGSPPQWPQWRMAVWGGGYLGWMLAMGWWVGQVPWVELVWFAIGWVLGVGVLWADQWLFWPEYREADDPGLPATQSVLFAVVLGPLLLFIVTSSGSRVGIAMMLAMATQLLGWWRQVLRQPELLPLVLRAGGIDSRAVTVKELWRGWQLGLALVVVATIWGLR